MSVTRDPAYDGDKFLDMMFTASYIVSRRPEREWFARERVRYMFHPFVVKAIRMCRPDNWHRLMLEWPHESTLHSGDMTKLAYTRDERAGIADKQTATSLGKYLHTHFSTLPDHAIRDIVALATPKNAVFKFVRTTVEMIHHLQRGPRSCMVWDTDSEDDPIGVEGSDGDWHHPYEAYDPALGWHMAVRIEGSDTVGRALCMDDGKNRFFVRSYKKVDGYSPADEQLEAWLKDQGYTKASSWDGCKLKRIPAENNCGFVAPYIDGSCQEVDVESSTLLRITSEGEYQCNNTNGDADEHDFEQCEDCGDRVRDGDGYWVGPWEDRMVCECCRENNYVYARSRNGQRRYIDADNCVYVDSQDEHYDQDYLDPNDIVETKDGDYEHINNVVQCEDNNAYYDPDDERIVRCVDDGYYHLRDEAHYHEPSGEWYADEDEMPKDEESESESE